MIYNYEIRSYQGKNVLYLYLTMNEEISSELGKKTDENLENRCKKYIKNKKINYDGDDVFLVVNGIVVKSLKIKNKDIHIELLDDKCDYANIKYKVNVREEKEEKVVTLKDYLMGVLFTNTSYDMPLEVLKALCVLYRSYTFYLMKENKFIDNHDSFMPYRNLSYYKLAFIDNYEVIYQKIEDAIDETDCIFITYQDQYIFPYIHHCNNGFTEESNEVPYLEKKYSLWDLLSPYYMRVAQFSYEQLKDLLNVSKEEFQNIKILEFTSGNKIKKIKVGPLIYTGEEFRKRLNLNSTDITILINDHDVSFITRGYGHGLGLSISGSSELARSGCSYLQILNYYFSKCKIKKYI